MQECFGCGFCMERLANFGCGIRSRAVVFLMLERVTVRLSFSSWSAWSRRNGAINGIGNGLLRSTSNTREV